MKKILFVFLLAMALTVSPAAAQVPSGATAVAGDVNLVAVLNHQDGGICNFDFANANSGLNTVNKGNTMTGNAGASNGAATVLNSNSTGVALADTGSGPSAVNYLEVKLPKHVNVAGIGFGSDLAIALDLNAVVVANFNMGNVSNMLMTSANTGFNTTVKGTSDTGNAVAGSTVYTNLNSNTNEIALLDSESGPNAVNWTEYTKSKKNCNEPTNPCLAELGGQVGPMGDLAVAIDANVAGVLNFNNGMVTNVVMTGANTGLNTTNKKSSDTGDAGAYATVATGVNTNHTTVMVADSGSGPVAVNTEVYNSKKMLPHFEDSIALAADVNLVGVANMNSAMVFNMVATNANSGANDTLKGNSTTGNAIASNVVGNTVNTNTTTVGLVDTGAGPSAVNSNQNDSTGTGSPCDPQAPCANTGGTTAANIGTSGTAVAVDATVVGVVSDNHATVVNAIAADANTGGNTTTGSQGNCASSPAPTSGTGNATASNSVSNTVNTNTTTVVVIK